MKISKPWWAAISVGVYYLGAAMFIFGGIPPGLFPKSLAPVLGLVSIPALLSIYLWVPVLKPLGLTNSGQWSSPPHWWVVILLVLFYCAAAYFIMALLDNPSNRKDIPPSKEEEG